MTPGCRPLLLVSLQIKIIVNLVYFSNLSDATKTMDVLNNVIWTERFWVPTGKTWKDLSNHEDNTIYIAQLRDLKWALPLGALLLLVRYAVEL